MVKIIVFILFSISFSHSGKDIYKDLMFFKCVIGAKDEDGEFFEEEVGECFFSLKSRMWGFSGLSLRKKFKYTIVSQRGHLDSVKKISDTKAFFERNIKRHADGTQTENNLTGVISIENGVVKLIASYSEGTVLIKSYHGDKYQDIFNNKIKIHWNF